MQFRLSTTTLRAVTGVISATKDHQVYSERWPPVRGSVVDDETRCVHYQTVLDVVALKFACCGEYYPCYWCHQETVDHPAQPWPAVRSDQPAVLCGVCRHELTVTEYSSADRCPVCWALFNPGCHHHRSLYFEDPDH